MCGEIVDINVLYIWAVVWLEVFKNTPRLRVCPESGADWQILYIFYFPLSNAHKIEKRKKKMENASTMNKNSCGEPKQGLRVSLDGLTRASFQLTTLGHRHLPIDNGNGREISEISLRSGRGTQYCWKNGEGSADKF